MALQLDYASEETRARDFATRALSWVLISTVLLNCPSVYVYVYEKLRLAADPHAYPQEWMERQPDFIFLWWLAGAVARLPIVMAAIFLVGQFPSVATAWRAIVTIVLVVGIFCFEVAVSFYDRLVG